MTNQVASGTIPSPISNPSMYGQPLIPLNPQSLFPVQTLTNGLQQMTVSPQTFTFPPEQSPVLSPIFTPANANQETAQSASLQAPARATPSPSPVPVRTQVAPAKQKAWGKSVRKKDP